MDIKSLKNLINKYRAEQKVKQLEKTTFRNIDRLEKIAEKEIEQLEVEIIEIMNDIKEGLEMIEEGNRNQHTEFLAGIKAGINIIDRKISSQEKIRKDLSIDTNNLRWILEANKIEIKKV